MYLLEKYFEYQYTKKDLINYLKIKNKSKILTSPQIWSGSFFLKKNRKNKNLLVSWIKIMKKNKLIDASISKKKENKSISILNLTIIFIISFIAFIILIDTFKYPISKIVPNIEFILYNLYETITDILLFFKDLI